MSKVSHDSETPAHGQQVITPTAFIHQVVNGKHCVFMAKRAATKKFLPHVYEIPGGHIEFGEDIVKGLIREIKEETGLSIAVADAFYAFTYMNHVKGSQGIEVVYFAHFIDPIENIRLHPEDHSGYDWFSEDQIEEVTKARDAHDQEVLAIKKGFALLSGEPLKF